MRPYAAYRLQYDHRSDGEHLPGSCEQADLPLGLSRAEWHGELSSRNAKELGENLRRQMPASGADEPLQCRQRASLFLRLPGVISVDDDVRVEKDITDHRARRGTSAVPTDGQE